MTLNICKTWAWLAYRNIEHKMCSMSMPSKHTNNIITHVLHQHNSCETWCIVQPLHNTSLVQISQVCQIAQVPAVYCFASAHQAMHGAKVTTKSLPGTFHEGKHLFANNQIHISYQKCFFRVSHLHLRWVRESARNDLSAKQRIHWQRKRKHFHWDRLEFKVLHWSLHVLTDRLSGTLNFRKQLLVPF